MVGKGRRIIFRGGYSSNALADAGLVRKAFSSFSLFF